MSASTSDSLARAIAYLGAVEVAPGFYARQRFMRPDYDVISEADLLLFDDASFGTGPGTRREAYGRWVRCKQFVNMPAWWTPERRFAVRQPSGIAGTFASLAMGPDFRVNVADARIVTADVTTGEEMPA